MLEGQIFYMECQTCHKEFEAKRSTAKFCSEACKKRYQRGGIAAASTTNLPIERIENTKEQIVETKWFCKACKQDLTKVSKTSELICICRTCVEKGRKHDDYCDCNKNEEQTITPNWKRNGFKNQEDAKAHIIKTLKENPSLKGMEVFLDNHIVKL